MINLKFINLKIEGFQSIGNAYLDFDNLGMCFIKGINNYDNKTRSNGSGKSSLLSSIYWCLFGKTSSGIGNGVVNKFSDTGCYVELCFTVDNVSYFIKRSQNHKKYKTNLVILKESEDISGRNKSDSEKLIKEIINLDEEVFSQMIFLSQGFANRFAVYTPKARRELLESLYNIDKKLDEFVITLKDKEHNYETIINALKTSVIELETKDNMLSDSIDKIKRDIENTNARINMLNDTIYNVKKEDIDDLQSQIKLIDNQLDKIQIKYNDYYNESNLLYQSMSNLKLQKDKTNNEIISFSNNKVCPTCGTILEDYNKNEHIQKHLKELKDYVINLNSQIDDINKQYLDSKDLTQKLLNKQNLIKHNKSVVFDKYCIKSEEYQRKLQKDTEIKSLIDKCDNYTKDIVSLRETIDDNKNILSDKNKSIEENNKKLDITQHSVRLANNQFKSYLLEHIVYMLNNKLKDLSGLLFENEIIQINGDSKLDILLGEKIYEQLSGGEQRKVDVAIIIAQRYLAQQMNAISSNILILDEVFDGLDDVSFGIVLDLLSDEIQDVESTFIISHRDVKEIPFDKIITVIKNENQISEIDMN